MPGTDKAPAASRPPNALIVGCGDIGARLGAALTAQGWRVGGLRRRTDALPPAIAAVRADLCDAEGLASALRAPWRTVAFMPTADAFSADAYRRVYLDGMRRMLESLRAWRPPPRRVVMLSSSSVYGQSDGAWVDESSPPRPAHFSGELMLETERCLRDSGLPHCVVRSAGIYGPRRDGMIRKLMSGTRERDGARYGNRIHSDDLAGFLAHLLCWAERGAPLRECYLACDDRPATLEETERWLADALGLDYAALAERGGARRGNKRCRNRLLRDSGYRLRYPDYRAGYRALLDALDGAGA